MERGRVCGLSERGNERISLVLAIFRYRHQPDRRVDGTWSSKGVKEEQGAFKIHAAGNKPSKAPF